MKKILKSIWKYIVVFFTGLIASIGAILTIFFVLNNQKEKKKEKIIDKNKDIIKESELKEKEHEKDITDSNNNYNDLINGKKPRNPKSQGS